ncbi:uncharacterized protein [Scyliorhinus torazame]|uniref:uncharacterized protein n=1 Tax=Scyliorhinus torazame TaxID=75743 RepID=UPI003B596127
MDLRIKPECLQLSPHADNSAGIFKHWLACFESFIDTAADTPTERQKMHLLRSRGIPANYPLIEEVENYAAAITLLEGHYIRPLNQVYARHLLATRRQSPDETLEDFYRALLVLGRKCGCPTVTGNEHTELLIRDAFVAGMSFPDICRRHLEMDMLGLTEARALEGSMYVAYKNALAFAPGRTAPPWAAWHPVAAAPQTFPLTPQACAARRPIFTAGQRFFCGQANHPRARCPARTVTYKGCSKKGHYVTVCQARAMAAVASDYQQPLFQVPAVQGPPPPSYPQATCDPLARPFCPPATTMDGWAPPFCPSPTPSSVSLDSMCDPWLTPSWMGPQAPSAADSTLPDRNSPLLQLASVTLDQSRPRTQAKATTTIAISGHVMSCLIDSGSTESFVHPDTEVLLLDLAPNLASDTRTRPDAETCEGAQVGPVGREGPPAACQPPVCLRSIP